MAQLDLTRVWVNHWETGAAVSGWSEPGRQAATTVDGEVRTYAGGRRRSISKAGVAGAYQVTLRLVSRADVETLKGWLGHTVQVRDNKGRVFVGAYYEVPEGEYQTEQTFDVALSLVSVSVEDV